jgi:hypothetical protein
MLTQDLINELYRDCNGALTRSELLKKVNTYQNWMLGRNCTEMEVQSTFTLAAEITVPIYQALTYTSRGPWANGVDYIPGDSLQNNNSYHRVVVPFTSATATRYSDVIAYCEPISFIEYAADRTEVITYVDGVVGATIPYGSLVAYGGDIYYAAVSLTSSTGVFEDDCNTASISRLDRQPPVSGTLVTGTEAVPEYIELDLREVVIVGLKDGNNEWTQTYDIRIQQSPDPSVPVKIYAADLPVGSPINYTGYRWPTQILTTATQLEIPVAHQEGLLRTMVMKSIEEAVGNVVYWGPLAKTQEGDWMNYINRSKQAAPRTARTQRYNPLAG